MSVASPLQAAPAKAQASVASTASGLLQRKCACGSPTSSLTGECAECKTKKRLQTKLAIGASNDPLEREADRIADQVLAAPANAAVRGAPPHIQRFTGQPSAPAGPAPASVDQALANPGRPLEPALRQDMERRFGHDFSRVRVHSGAAAEQSARDVNANAYAVGRNMVFGTGRFAPGTNEGRRLIAHELTHVVQQREGAIAMQGNLTIGQPHDRCEQETDRMAEAVTGANAAEARQSATVSVMQSNHIQRARAPCEAARAEQTEEHKKPEHKSFTFEDLMAEEMKQGEEMLETTETEEGMPQKSSLTTNVKPQATSEKPPKKEKLQRPYAGSATIVCESGAYVVKLNSWAGKPCGIPDCVTAHEKSHIVDWQGRWPKGCKKADGTNQADGYLPVGGDGYAAFLKTSECTAHTKDLECAAEKLKGATGDCKTKWESYIKLTDAQKKAYC